MTISIQASLKDGKRVELLHKPSGTTITTAAPVDNNGDGSSFSPTDLLAAALVSCTLTVIAIVAERNGYQLHGTYASIEKRMANNPRRIEQLLMTLHLPAQLSDEARKKLINAANTCPVGYSLHQDILIGLTVLYDC